MKEVVRGMKLQLQQYRELAAFTQFGASDLDRATLQQLRRGERLQEMLKQPQYEPLSLDREVAIIYAGTRGLLDDVPLQKVTQFERDLYRFMDTQYRELAERIRSQGKWGKDVDSALREMIDDFKKTHSYSEQKAAPPPAAGGEPRQRQEEPARQAQGVAR
jgi:F-type H+-transporting ATPase subunit alpha